MRTVGEERPPAPPWVGFLFFLIFGYILYQLLTSPYKVTLVDTRPPVVFACPENVRMCTVDYVGKDTKYHRKRYTCFAMDEGRCDVEELPVQPQRGQETRAQLKGLRDLLTEIDHILDEAESA